MKLVQRMFLKSLGRFPVRMSGLALIALMTLAGPATSQIRAQTPWITGYYSAGNGNLPISQIPWAKYTHVLHFAASTDGTGAVIDYYLTPAEISLINQSKPPGTKVLVVLKDNDNNLTYFPQSASNTTVFAANIVSFVVTNGYDGVDFDWEKNVNVPNYDSLLSAVRSDFAARVQLGLDSTPRVVTMAANPNTAQVAIDNTWQAANGGPANLDQVNVMCYDLDWGSSVSWYVDALLNGSSTHPTCDWDIRHFTTPDTNGHFVPNKLIGVGLPYYGKRWPHVTQALQNSNFSNTTTFYYRDLVTDTKRWQPQYQQWDGTYDADYLSINSGNLKEFDSYTGTDFIQKAAVPWQASQGFGGFMAFTIEYEHLSANTCDAAFPLTTALYNAANPNSPGAILTVLSGAGGNGQASLSWTPCSGAASYILNSSNNGTAYNQTSVTGASYTVGNLTNGATYYFYLTALNSQNIPVGNSNQISVVPADTSNLPLPPTNLTASSPAKRQIQISWTAPSDATSSTTYKIYRSTGASGPPWTYIDTTSNTSYLNMGMGSGVTYYYVVTAIEAGVESPYSNVAYATAK